jgi:hypothetical protein
MGTYTTIVGTWNINIQKQLVDLNGIRILSFDCLHIDLWQFVQAMTYDWHVIVDGTKTITMKYKDEAQYKSYRDECYDKCRLSQDKWKCLYCQKICKSKNRLNCHRMDGCKKAVDANGKPLRLMLYPHGGLIAPFYYEWHKTITHLSIGTTWCRYSLSTK